MKKQTYREPPSRLSAAHQALYNRQEKLDRYLTYDEAERTLLHAPGFTFGEGKIVNDLLRELERYHLVTCDGLAERVFVYAFNKSKEKRNRSAE